MFEIGQQVVCVKTHPKSVVVKDHVYTVRDIKAVCKCGISVDVGINKIHKNNIAYCADCGNDFLHHGAYWLDPKRFVPIDDILNEEIEELVNTELVEA